MISTDLSALINRLGLTHSDAARLCGVDPRTMRRWLSGKQDIPPPAERLLRASERDAGLVRWLREMKP